MEEPTKEQMFRAYDEAPAVVRRALQPEGLAMLFVDEMADKYKLHVDVAGTIAVLIRDMILGFISPNYFSMELQRVGVAEGTARQILIDLNTKVFVPLRNEVRKGGASYPSQPPQTPVPAVSKPSLVPERELSHPEPVSPSPSINLMEHVQQKSAPEPVVAVPAAKASVASIPVPTMRTMQHDMELVQHGSMPAPYPVASGQLHPAQATPARMFQTASVPVTAPVQKPPEMLHVVPDSRPLALPRKTPDAAPARDYTSDPYREPI